MTRLSGIRISATLFVIYLVTCAESRDSACPGNNERFVDTQSSDCILVSCRNPRPIRCSTRNTPHNTVCVCDTGYARAGAQDAPLGGPCVPITECGIIFDRSRSGARVADRRGGARVSASNAVGNSDVPSNRSKLRAPTSQYTRYGGTSYPSPGPSTYNRVIYPNPSPVYPNPSPVYPAPSPTYPAPGPSTYNRVVYPAPGPSVVYPAPGPSIVYPAPGPTYPVTGSRTYGNSNYNGRSATSNNNNNFAASRPVPDTNNQGLSTKQIPTRAGNLEITPTNEKPAVLIPPSTVNTNHGGKPIIEVPGPPNFDNKQGQQLGNCAANIRYQCSGSFLGCVQCNPTIGECPPDAPMYCTPIGCSENCKVPRKKEQNLNIQPQQQFEPRSQQIPQQGFDQFQQQVQQTRAAHNLPTHSGISAGQFFNTLHENADSQQDDFWTRNG